jgi:hypothetical protein
MEETVIQKILSESYNVCNLQCVKLLIKRVLEVREVRKMSKSYKLQNALCKPLKLTLMHCQK